MSQEGQLLDRKSLRAVLGKTADWGELVKDCVAFANATGGHLLIGIEDDHSIPPADQQIPVDLPDTLRRKLAERTVNVGGVAQHSDGRQWRPIHRPEHSACHGCRFDHRWPLLSARRRPEQTGHW